MTLYKTQHTMVRPRVMTAALLFSATFAFGAVGCASILGIETGDEVATDGEGKGGVPDPETEIQTTDQCIEYCDLVMANCTEDNAQYIARASCINTCNHLPPGSAQDAEPSDNTVLCRVQKAKNAAEGLASEHCAAAGPGGGAECGTNCESWCLLLDDVCTEKFNLMGNCEASCAVIPGGESFSVNSYSDDQDDIQCRIAHLGAATSGLEEDKVHCDHAAFSTTGKCLGDATAGEVSCERYCQNVMGACLNDLAVYKDTIECEASCVAFELGEFGDESENTIACRTYHSGAALGSPKSHCPHAGPTGDGHCGNDASDGSSTGNCESYCRVYAAGCSEDFSTRYGDDGQAACVAECSASDIPGIKVDSGYSYSTAGDADNLACRVRRSIEARAAGEAAPEHADLCSKAALIVSCD